MNVSEIFACHPDEFLESPERLIAVMRAREKEADRHDAYRFVLAHWEEMAGVPCPDDLANLLRAFAETGAYNTAIGEPVVMATGYGNALLLPSSSESWEDQSVAWEGMFGAMLGDDPGADHASGLQDLVQNRIEIGGDPFYWYLLDTGRVARPTATSLSAMVYAAALLVAHLLEWSDEEYEKAAVKGLKHLAHRSGPARRLLDCLDERGSTVEHDEPWEPDWTVPNLVAVDGPGESVQTRDWVLKLRSTAGLEEYYGTLEDEQLLELRVWLEAAEQPADAMPCAATAIYAGLHAYLLAPDRLDAWLDATADHPSRLVADARATMAADASPNLVRWRALAEKAMELSSPTKRLAHVDLDPLIAQHLHTHGTL